MFEFLLHEEGYEERHYTAGSTIQDTRTLTEVVYYVKQGHAELQVYTSDLRPGLWFPFNEGDFIGVIEAFSESNYPVSEIIALSDCVIQSVTIPALLKRLERDTELAMVLLKSMAEQMMKADRWNLMLNTCTIVDKCTAVLATHHKNATLANLRKEQLAHELSVPVRSLNRALAEIADIVKYQDKHFIVLNASKLFEHYNDIMSRFDLNT